jgi:two-component system response regulator (stage 0 sporulation protein A)
MINVMIADDSKIFVDAVEKHLNLQDDMQVVAKAYDGLCAIQQIKEHEPDVILLDMMMPELDGIGVLELIENEIEKKPLTIMLSSVNKENVIKQAIDKNAQYYILKPIENYSFISQKIREYIKSDMHFRFKKNVSDILKKLGFNLSYKGTHFLMQAIEMAHSEKRYYNDIDYLYENIAEFFETNSLKVKWSIDCSVRNMNKYCRKNKCERLDNDSQQRISSDNLIRKIVDKLKESNNESKKEE